VANEKEALHICHAKSFHDDRPPNPDGHFYLHASFGEFEGRAASPRPDDDENSAHFFEEEFSMPAAMRLLDDFKTNRNPVRS